LALVDLEFGVPQDREAGGGSAAIPHILARNGENLKNNLKIAD
jgi:hypothetical protein